jgi:hypothetical protein
VSKKNTNKPYQLLTDLGTKTIKLTLLLFTVGIGLQFVSKSRWEKVCTNNSEKLECVYLAPYAREMSTSLVTSAITILAIEILLKRESLEEIKKFKSESIEEIKEILKATEATRSIRAFYSKFNLYKEEIVNDIKQAPKAQEIKMLGLSSLELEILGGVGANKLIEKICREGYNLRIIILHPESMLLKCLEKLEYRRTRSQINGRVHDTFKTFVIDLTNYVKLHKLQDKILGSIEVRTHKDIFSPVFYYSGNKLNIVGLYFSLGKQSEHPAFDILDMEMKEQVDNHFEEIWDKSSGIGTILKWNIQGNSDVNNVMEIFPE